jgi:hypothetical protein
MTPRWERMLGEFTGKVLMWLGKRAYRRGDTHEYGHIVLALRAGDTGPGHVEPCLLDEAFDLYQEGKWRD